MTIYKIFKFSMKIEHEQIIRMHVNAEILTLQTQNGVPCIWAKVDPSNDMEKRTFFIFGTGHNINEYSIDYIGTFQTINSGFVGHVFEKINLGQRT